MTTIYPTDREADYIRADNATHGEEEPGRIYGTLRRQPGIVGPAMPEPGTCPHLVTRWAGWGFISDYCGNPEHKDGFCKEHYTFLMD